MPNEKCRHADIWGSIWWLDPLHASTVSQWTSKDNLSSDLTGLQHVFNKMRDIFLSNNRPLVSGLPSNNNDQSHYKNTIKLIYLKT